MIRGPWGFLIIPELKFVDDYAIIFSLIQYIFDFCFWAY